ncbi:hypothetical protein JCM8097_003446 [Rhodosporidiobolus ruineniae]
MSAPLAADSAAPAAPAPVPGTEYDVGLNRDGEKVKDPSYYQLFGIMANADDAVIKKAYRKAAIKWHPDKNPGNPEAEAKFHEISEAYTILSDSNSRAVYDKHGKQSAMGEAGGEEVMPNPGDLFAAMFGGKAFEDWIGEISLGKEVSKAFEQADEEEKAEISKAETEGKPVAAAVPTPPLGAPSATSSSALHSEPHVEAAAADAASSAAAASGVPPAYSAPTSPTAAAVPEKGSAVPPPQHPSSAASASSAAGAGAHDHSHAHGKSPLAGKPPKLTAEQKAKAYEEEKKAWEEKRRRIETLAAKLRDRVRPFVEATAPGQEGDQETKRFEERMREEVRDLAMESFGVELCHLLGEIYMQKASTYLRLHRKPSSNLLGLPGWWSRVKEKGATLKEGWSFLSTGLDVQRAMVEMERRQEKGELGEEEMRRMEEELSGTLLLVAWKGSKFELSAVLRQVVDLALTKDTPQVTDAVLLNRAKAILFLGALLKAVQPEEGDDERRELERLVAQAQQRRKERKAGKGKKVDGTTTPPVVVAGEAVKEEKK